MGRTRSTIGRRTTDGTSSTAALEIIAGSRACWIKELIISLAAATASIYGLGRPAAKGITPTAPVTSLLESEGDAQLTVTTAVAWGTGPTVPAQFLRRVGFPAAIGTSQTFYFTNGLFIPANESVVVWNIGSGPFSPNGVVDVTIVAEEQQ